MKLDCVVCELPTSESESYKCWNVEAEVLCVCSEKCWLELLENPELYGWEADEEEVAAARS